MAFIQVGVSLREATPAPVEEENDYDYWNDPFVWQLVDEFESRMCEGADTVPIEAALRLAVQGKLPPALKSAGGEG